MQFLAVFFTTYHTLSAEKIFKKLKIKNKTIIKPRKITTDCGLAIEFDSDFLNKLDEEFKLAKLKLEGFYRKIDNEWTRINVD
ncbi:DUF3343 domain-containing protein [Candidatus Desantisbacteria bacterium]|nr:DUF3343 domain-containing protein [Candidatus Desantisbacteria bacterium]